MYLLFHVAEFRGVMGAHTAACYILIPISSICSKSSTKQSRTFAERIRSGPFGPVPDALVVVFTSLAVVSAIERSA